MSERPLSPAVQKLIAAYARELPERCATLRAALPQQPQPDPESLQELETEVHKLAGSSGSYGFRDLSAALRQLDRYLQDCRHGDAAWSPEQAAQLWQQVEAALPASAH